MPNPEQGGGNRWLTAIIATLTATTATIATLYISGQTDYAYQAVAPGNPAANYARLYADNSGNIVKKLSDGSSIVLGSSTWSGLGAPTGNLALSHAAYTTAFTWNATTGANNLFTLQDTVNNTGTGYLFSVETKAASAAKAFRVVARGGTILDMDVDGNISFGKTLTAGTGPTTLTDAAGKILSAALNTVVVGQGGTGKTTWTQYGVLYAPTTTSLGDLGAMTDGQIIIGQTGAAPVVSSLTAGAGVSITPGAGSITIAATGTLSGGGTATKVAKWTGATALGDSSTTDTGTAVTIATTAGVAGSPTAVTITAPAHVTLANAEVVDLDINLARTVTLTGGGGAIATQRAARIQAPVYAAGAAQTITDASTLAISGPPTAGANVTITGANSLRVESGNALFSGLIKAGSGPTTLTDAAGKVLSAALNTVAVGQGGTGLTTWNAYAIPYASAADTLAELGSAKIRPASDPGAFAAVADVDGANTYLRTQSGGAHTLNNPRGGDLVVQCGAAGAGGTGRAGRFQILSGNMNLDAQTAKSMVYLDANKDVVSTAAPTNGQLLIGSTGNVPVLAGLTAGAGITVTPGAGSITIAATGGSGTLTVALTDAATISVDASLGIVNSISKFWVVLGGDRTLGNPSNPTDGQTIMFAVTQDGTGTRLLTFDTKYRFGTDITGATLTTTINKTDYITCRYVLSADKWDVIGFVKGY